MTKDRAGTRTDTSQIIVRREREKRKKKKKKQAGLVKLVVGERE